MQTGAAQPHIYPKDFERLMVIIYNETIDLKLEGILSSFFDIIANNKKQAQTLTQLRDTLLPKLLSGQLRIADVENFIKD